MANQNAFGEFQVADEQIDITATLKIPKQILLIAQDDIVRQLAKTSRECRLVIRDGWNSRHSARDTLWPRCA